MARARACVCEGLCGEFCCVAQSLDLSLSFSPCRAVRSSRAALRSRLGARRHARARARRRERITLGRGARARPSFPARAANGLRALKSIKASNGAERLSPASTATLVDGSTSFFEGGAHTHLSTLLSPFSLSSSLLPAEKGARQEEARDNSLTSTPWLAYAAMVIPLSLEERRRPSSCVFFARRLLYHRPPCSLAQLADLESVQACHCPCDHVWMRGCFCGHEGGTQTSRCVLLLLLLLTSWSSDHRHIEQGNVQGCFTADTRTKEEDLYVIYTWGRAGPRGFVIFSGAEGVTRRVTWCDEENPTFVFCSRKYQARSLNQSMNQVTYRRSPS